MRYGYTIVENLYNTGGNKELYEDGKSAVCSSVYGYKQDK